MGGEPVLWENSTRQRKIRKISTVMSVVESVELCNSDAPKVGGAVLLDFVNVECALKSCPCIHDFAVALLRGVICSPAEAIFAASHKVEVADEHAVDGVSPADGAVKSFNFLQSVACEVRREVYAKDVKCPLLTPAAEPEDATFNNFLRLDRVELLSKAVREPNSHSSLLPVQM